MARPRWQDQASQSSGPWTRGWDRFVAVWASVNLLWVAFDISYLPLRTFWLQRNLYPIPSVPLVVPLGAIPDITPWIDPIKGIEPHRETQAYLGHFRVLDRAMLPLKQGQPLSPGQRSLLKHQAQLTAELIDANPFLASEGSATLEKIKYRLRQRANQNSARQAAAQLLSAPWLEQQGWAQERTFWQGQVLPLVATNYWRSIDGNGRPTDHFWRIDLLLFQSIFALDIGLRVIRLRRRLPGLRWRDALLRRWVDLPLLLPFWRWLRLLPVIERLQSSGLINIEPLRAVVSQGERSVRRQPLAPPFGRPLSALARNHVGSEHATPCGSKWDIPCGVRTSMPIPLRCKPVSAGWWHGNTTSSEGRPSRHRGMRQARS